MGQEQKAIFLVVILKQFDTKDLSNHQKFFFLNHEKKNSHVFFLKKVGGALIRVGALIRDYMVRQLAI